MTDKETMKDFNDSNSQKSEDGSRRTRSNRGSSKSVGSKRKSGKLDMINLKLLTFDDGTAFDYFKPPKPGIQEKIDFINDEFDTIKGFNEDDRKVSAAKKTSLAALKHAAVQHVDYPEEYSEWLKTYENSWNSSTTIGTKTRTLALRLALTDPMKLFRTSEWINGHLVLDELSAAWLASQQLLGSLWLADYTESVYSFEDELKRVEGEGLQLVAYAGKYKGFVAADFDVKADENPHLVERNIRALILKPESQVEMVKADWQTQMPPEKWQEVFSQVVDPIKSSWMDNLSEIRSFAIRLIQTHPSDLVGLWLNGQVVSCPLTYAWRAAIDVLGEAWTNEAKDAIETFLGLQAEEDRRTQDAADVMQHDEVSDSDKMDVDENEEDTNRTGTPQEKAAGLPANHPLKMRLMADYKVANMNSNTKDFTSGRGDTGAKVVASEFEADRRRNENQVKSPHATGSLAKGFNSVSTSVITESTTELSQKHQKPGVLKKAPSGGVSFCETVSVRAVPRSLSPTGNESLDEPPKKVSQKWMDYQKKVSKRLYISKAPRTERKNNEMVLVNPIFVREFTTFLKVKLPAFQYDYNHKDSAEEVAEIWHKLSECLFQVDDKLIILPWTNNKVEPFHNRSPTLRSKNAVSRFVDRIFVKAGEVSWFRIKVGHNRDRAEFSSENAGRVFEAAEIVCYPDPLQCQKSACAGWFFGSHEQVNCKDLVVALKQNKHLRDIEFEIRYHAIRITSTRVRVAPDKVVKACHLHAEVQHIAKVKKVLNKVYGRRQKTGFPLGKIFRFIPFTADATIPLSQQTVHQARTCFRLQRSFLSKIDTTRNVDIIGLDYIPESIGVSLREAIMSICHPNDKKKSLFLSVDDSKDGLDTVFVFRNDEKTVQLVHSVVPVLSVIMEAHFGPAAWNWFSDEAKKKTNGFLWDPDRKIVFVKDEESLADSVYDLAPGIEDPDEEEYSEDDEEFAEVYGFDTAAFSPLPVRFMTKMSVVQQINDEKSVGSFESAAMGISSDVSWSSAETSDVEADGDAKMGTSTMATVKQTSAVESPVPHTLEEIAPPTADSSLTMGSGATGHKMSTEDLEKLLQANFDTFITLMERAKTDKVATSSVQGGDQEE